MQVQNAIRRLERHGFTARPSSEAPRYSYTNGREVIDFSTNPGSIHVHTIRVRRSGDLDDPMQDYCAGVFADNLSQALRIAGVAK